jgi:nucleoside-diphosphate-sugar epimerase
MIIGSGLLARAFAPYFGVSEDTCVYAAGVSNSGCTDHREFQRERDRLTTAIAEHRSAGLFIYFGTCSASVSSTPATPYIAHKVKMETIATTHPSYLILRLPQVAGHTANPHTLLNFLFNRISRSERFQVWARARRNIIDVEDAARIAAALVSGETVRRERIDVGNFSDRAVPDIVHIMATVVGKRPICDYLDRGDEYIVDTRRIGSAVERLGVSFNGDYVERVIRKYYSNPVTVPSGISQPAS